MCIPFAVSGVLLFSVPASWASTPKLVYVFITCNLVSTVIYTAINVPYSALNALMTQDPYERSVLSIFRNLLATAGTLTINTFTLPLVEYFGNNAAAWTKTFVIFGFVAIAAFLCTFFGIKERVRAAENEGEVQTEDVPFVTGIKALFKNKYWIMMTGMLALFFLMYSVNGGATVYYAKDILGDKNLVSTINGIFNIVQICGMFFIAMLVKKFGKRNVFALGLVLDIIGMLVLNFSGGSMAIIVVSSVIRGIGNACGGAIMWAMVSDTIDYGEWKTGCRTEGGQSVLNGVEGSQQESLSPEEKKEIYETLVKAQLELWEKGSGYFYWSYKLLTDTVNTPGWIGWDSWDLGRCYDFGWFPADKGGK